MNAIQTRFLRPASLLAINLLLVMVWGFTGLGKLIDGMPPWFGDKFGKTILASFPGLTASFWMLAVLETLAFILAVIALLKAEFLERRTVVFLPGALVLSLFLFVQLGFGQWLTNEFNAAQQLFMYFCGTLVALYFAAPALRTGNLTRE